MGGAFNNMVYFIPIPEGDMAYNIAHLAMLNVVVALKCWGRCSIRWGCQILYPLLICIPWSYFVSPEAGLVLLVFESHVHVVFFTL